MRSQCITSTENPDSADEYLHDDDENSLEQQIDGKALGEPEEDPEDTRDHEDGAHVDGEGAQ